MDGTLACDLIRFLHVVGALGIPAAYAVEAAGLVGLRRSTTADEARAWIQTRRWVLLLGPFSIGLVLVTGLYLTIVAWGAAGWILVSLGSLLAIGLIGGVLTGIPIARIGPRIESAAGPLPQELRRGLRTQVLTVSITTRVAITVGIVYLMVLRPTLPPSWSSVWRRWSGSTWAWFWGLANRWTSQNDAWFVHCIEHRVEPVPANIILPLTSSRRRKHRVCLGKLLERQDV